MAKKKQHRNIFSLSGSRIISFLDISYIFCCLQNSSSSLIYGIFMTLISVDFVSHSCFCTSNFSCCGTSAIVGLLTFVTGWIVLQFCTYGVDRFDLPSMIFLYPSHAILLLHLFELKEIRLLQLLLMLLNPRSKVHIFDSLSGAPSLSDVFRSKGRLSPYCDWLYVRTYFHKTQLYIRDPGFIAPLQVPYVVNRVRVFYLARVLGCIMYSMYSQSGQIR